MATVRTYPSDVNDDEWSFTASYLDLISEEAAQRVYPLRDVFNALRYLARMNCPWRYLPPDLSPWHAVYQQWMRWRNARVFETLVHDLNELQRVLLGRPTTPTAVVVGRPRTARHDRERVSRKLRWAQAAQRQQSAQCRRHVGPPAKRRHHVGQ